MRQVIYESVATEPSAAAMAPAAPDISKAEAILLKAYAADWGPVQHEGELHDRATYRYFWEQLERAHVMKMPVGAEAERLFFAEKAAVG